MSREENQEYTHISRREATAGGITSPYEQKISNSWGYHLAL
jgi:hypothetical protein